MAPALSSSRARRSGPSARWLQWQGSPVSQRLLSETDREAGFTVLQVPPPLREPFLDVAQMLLLYKRRIHDRHHTLTTDELKVLRAWSEATQALLAMIQAVRHD